MKSYNSVKLIYTGVTLTLGGTPSKIMLLNILFSSLISTAQVATEALLCWSELSHDEVGIGDWYLHPTQQSIENEDKSNGKTNRGWYRNRALSGNKQLVRLMRVSATAEEGVFTCLLLEMSILQSPWVSTTTVSYCNKEDFCCFIQS